MKNRKQIILLLFTVLTSFPAFSQVQELFMDGDFATNPRWIGTPENFMVNGNNQVQLNIIVADTSYLATASTAIKNAQWEASCIINYNPSSSNYACFYLTAQSPNLPFTQGYFVQIGNTADEVSLYRQDSTSKTKIIDGLDGRVNRNPVDVRIKVTRDSLGEWVLYSKLASETNFVLEGTVMDFTYKTSNYAGFLCKNSASVGKSYFFDSIQISGGKYDELEIPQQKVYKRPSLGDLVINEVLFNSSEDIEEFVELYNNEEEVLDLGGIKVMIRRTDGTLGVASTVSFGTYIQPKGYLALCKTPSVDSLYFNCPEESRFASMSSWPVLSNEGAVIVICNAAKDSIFDELAYSPKWHHPLIKNEQGVSLERINSDLPTQDSKSWHSASSEVNYATPGYKNSQYLEINSIDNPKEFWIDRENFTPNNDGVEDMLLVHYKLNETAWMANITIFDAGGQPIKSLYKSYLLSAEGMLSWDGTTTDNRPANIGLYVIYVEMFNAGKGKTKRFKLVCVVSGR